MYGTYNFHICDMFPITYMSHSHFYIYFSYFLHKIWSPWEMINNLWPMGMGKIYEIVIIININFWSNYFIVRFKFIKMSYTMFEFQLRDYSQRYTNQQFKFTHFSRFSYYHYFHITFVFGNRLFYKFP